MGLSAPPAVARGSDLHAMEAGSSEEQPPPKPRRAGSFHPKSVRIRDDSLEEPLVDGDALEAPPEPPAAASAPAAAEEPDADVASPVSASRLLLFLTLCPVLIAALVAALLVLDRKEPWVWLWVLPNALSILGSSVIIACWLAFPELRSAHTGQMVFLSVADVFYSCAWIVYAARNSSAQFGAIL